MAFRVGQETIDLLIEENRIDVDSIEPLRVDGLSEGTRVFRVRGFPKSLNAFIVDTEAGARIASVPELVGEEFLEENLKVSEDAVRAMVQLVELEEPVVFLHVLRASMGYRLHEALRGLGVELAEAYVRVRYATYSYRDHVARRVEVVYKDFERVPRDCATLIVADTVATGASLEAALKTAYEELSARNANLGRIVLYGFLSAEGLERVRKLASDMTKEICAFAMQDITPLAHNRYDMPLYGPDESLWKEKGRLEMLGAIVDRGTLERMLPDYAPGMDQPGDWSERQPTLYNGYGYERGDIAGHLEKSLSLLETLRDLSRETSWYGPWVEEVFDKRRRGLLEALSKYR